MRGCAWRAGAWRSAEQARTELAARRSRAKDRCFWYCGAPRHWLDTRAMQNVQERSSNGKVSQVMGPVVDVWFPPGALPELQTALRVTNTDISEQADNLVL